MSPRFPFMIDSNGQEISEAMELALSFAQAMQKRDEGGLPFVRRKSEAPTALVKVTIPVLVKRAFSADRFLFSDLSQFLGDRLNLPVRPDFSLRENNWQIREDDYFSNDALLLAQKCASMTPLQYDSSIITIFAGLGEVLKKEFSMLTTQPWGVPIPVADDQIGRIRGEQEEIIRWFSHFNAENDTVDQLLRALKDAGSRRLEFFEMQKNRALQLLNEEISTLEPKVNQQMGDLNQQQALLQQQKSALQVRFAELDEQITLLQGEIQKYQNTSPLMAGYYSDRVKKTREEMRYLSDQQAKNEESFLEEVSARSLLLKRPLAVLEQQRQQADRQWQQAINGEQDLLKSLSAMLQEVALAYQQANRELLSKSQQVSSELPEVLRLEMPFVIVRMQNEVNSRYLVLPPATVRPAGQISSFLTDLVRGVRLPLSSRGAGWEELARMIEERINRQLPENLYNVISGYDLLRRDYSSAQIEDGIAQLKQSSLLSDKMSDQLFSQVREVLQAGPQEDPQ
ncbi:MAG: hypothetical protein FWE76_08270 [Symbiobacteriaceae bacterium]|nr:hypothetical protein [Symbiobacteriaceae bacterium]